MRCRVLDRCDIPEPVSSEPDSFDIDDRWPPREKEILCLMRRGLRYEHIAASLGLTVGSVRTMAQSAKNRSIMGFRSRKHYWRKQA